MVDLITPSLSLGGTAAESLIEDYTAAMESLRLATESLCRTAPHARDYVGRSQALALATEQHRDRVRRVAAVIDELQALAIAVADGPPNRWEQAARAAGWTHGGDFGGFIYDGNEFESWKAAASADSATTYGSWEECCTDQGIAL